VADIRPGIVRLGRILINTVYAPQTKILEDRTNLSECVFEALFKGVSTRFGRRIVAKRKGWFGLPKSSFGRGTVGTLDINTAVHSSHAITSSSYHHEGTHLMLSSSCELHRHIFTLSQPICVHVGNNISAKYPRRIL
jgi:hypothetical protein